jgi:hypothetical protein
MSLSERDLFFCFLKRTVGGKSMKTEDLNKERLPRILHEIAADGVPNGADLWPSIRARLKPNQRRVRLAALRPATRLGWAGLALAAVLVVSTVAYAVGPIISSVFQMIPGWQYVEEKHLTQDIHLSQTVDGVTVTLAKVYADASQILVGYGVSGLANQDVHIEVALTDEKGTVFRELQGAGVTGASELLGVTVPEGDGGYLVAFDGATVEGAPAALQLRLVMELSRWVPVTSEPGPVTIDGQLVEPPATVQASAPVTYEKRSTVGPFTFDFRVPFLPARVADVQQTAHASGMAVRLERVIVAPSETRFVTCFQSPGGEEMEWVAATGTLHTGPGRNYELGYELRDRLVQADGQVCYVYGLVAPLADQHGKWTLKMSELVGFEMKEPYGQSRIAGPWVFRFRVP